MLTARRNWLSVIVVVSLTTSAPSVGSVQDRHGSCGLLDIGMTCYALDDYRKGGTDHRKGYRTKVKFIGDAGCIYYQPLSVRVALRETDPFPGAASALQICTSPTKPYQVMILPKIWDNTCPGTRPSWLKISTFQYQTYISEYIKQIYREIKRKKSPTSHVSKQM